MKVYEPDQTEIPSGLCECGCGTPTKIAQQTVRRRRHFKGYPMPYLRGHSKQKYGADHHRWKGGRVTHYTGYVLLRMPDHPHADPKGYVREHRYVLEQHLGRILEKWEHVHHLNGIKGDNRVENLVIMTSGAHSTLHAPTRRYDSETMRAAGYKGHAVRWGYVKED